MSIIEEGLRPNDLEDTVLPLISIDEYESKISESTIVIAFFITDKDAANDFNRFIQKSPYGVIDSDISNTIDKNGYYIVFVELFNDNKIVTNIVDILEELNNLTRITDWSMKLRKQKTQDFDKDVLKDYIKSVSRNDTPSIKGTVTLFDKF